MKNIDICVLTAGRFDLLKSCLDAIKEEIQDTPCNVYVLDNGSPSEELVTFKSLFEQPFITRVKRFNTNKGFPTGANAAIKMGTAPLVLFVSDDIVLQRGSIKSLIETMKDQTIGLCGLKLLFPKYSNDPSRPAGTVQHVGHTVNLRGEIVHPFLGWSATNPKTCISREMFSVTGATWMARRDILSRSGMYAEDYGLGYYEDVEMALHIRALGYKIWVDTNAIAEHFVGATFQKLGPANFENNRSLFMSRNSQYITWTDWEVR